MQTVLAHKLAQAAYSASNLSPLVSDWSIIAVFVTQCSNIVEKFSTCWAHALAMFCFPYVIACDWEFRQGTSKAAPFCTSEAGRTNNG